MNWEPKTEEQVLAEQLCPEGLTPFTVMSAEVTVSKSEKNAGKEMLKVKLNVHGDDWFDYHVYDYVAPWFLEHKFRHFWYAVGRGQDYEKGTADIDGLTGLTGWCDIGIQKAKGTFGPKNIIKDYKPQDYSAKKPAEKPTKVVAKHAVKPGEDDAPF